MTQPLSTSIQIVFRYAITDGVPWCSLKVALVVGVALNVINQGEAIIGSGSPNYLKMLLTFAVPYLVSTHGAITARLRHESGKVETGCAVRG